MRKKKGINISKISHYTRRELKRMGYANAYRMKQNEANAKWIKLVFGDSPVSPKAYIESLYNNGYFNDKDLRTVTQRNKANGGIKNKKKFKYKEYEKYLKSTDWANIRKIILTRDGNKCCMCGDIGLLHIHHLNYENIFNELSHLEDLITLCKTCHSEIHGRIGGKNTIPLGKYESIYDLGLK